MDLSTVAVIVTAGLTVAASFAFYAVGKATILKKARQASEVFEAFRDAIEDDKVSKEELERVWSEIQELLGLKEEA